MGRAWRNRCAYALRRPREADTGGVDSSATSQGEHVRMLTFRRSNRSAPLVALAGLTLVLVACMPGSSTGAPTGSPAAAGNIQLHISKDFDTRATEADLWNSGTISAD